MTIKRVLVTGGAGFIGSHYVRRILGAESSPAPSPLQDLDTVIVLDKLTYAGNLANLASVVDDPRLELIIGDICDGNLVDSVLPGVDAVINFAAETHVDRSIQGPQDFIMTNVVGAQTLFDACLRQGTARVVHIGTDEVYGSIDAGSWTEDAPLQPNSPYSAAKAAAELLVRAYHHTYGMNISSTRCSNNYGPYQYPEKVIPLFVTNLLRGLPVPLYGDGGNIRDWLHVDDHCQGIDVVLTAGTPGTSYNIGGGIEMTNRDLTANILAAMDKPWHDWVRQVPDRLGHDRRYSVNDDRIRAIGYQPQHDLATGLGETIDWYRQNTDWWAPIVGV
ncbi:MAG: dTDP-glucose 4,6-dehydratase [Candidatus Nanopelagicales bacterium]